VATTPDATATATATTTKPGRDAPRRPSSLLERDQPLHRLFRQAPGFIAVLEGPEHRFVFHNDAYARAFGERGAIGRTAREAFPDLDGQGFFDLLDRVYRTGERYAAFDVTARIRLGPEGRWTDVVIDFVYEPIRDDDGRVTGIFCEGLDATERHRAQQALAATETKYEDLFASIDEGFYVAEILVDDAGRPFDYRFLEANPAFRIHTGLDDPVGRTAREMVPGLEPFWIDTYGRVGLTGEPIRFQAQATGLKGRHFDVYAFRTGDPALRRVGVLFQDITEKQALLRELRDSDRRKDEFLAMLAHELRNPLAPVRNGLRVLERFELDARGRAIVELCSRQVRHMSRLVDDLLEVSRISRGRIALKPEKVLVAQSVLAVAESMSAAMEERGQRVEFDLPREAVRVTADPTRLAQMVENLLSNASKYSDPGAAIAVRVAREGDEAVVEVTDAGVGIAPEDLERVFELFVQIDSTLDRARGGLGIGLALVRRLAAAHGGSVVARSPGRGRGSTFRLALPIRTT
jgi:signal transduction histidine kinase